MGSTFGRSPFSRYGAADLSSRPPSTHTPWCGPAPGRQGGAPHWTNDHGAQEQVCSASPGSSVGGMTTPHPRSPRSPAGGSKPCPGSRRFAAAGRRPGGVGPLWGGAAGRRPGRAVREAGRLDSVQPNSATRTDQPIMARCILTSREALSARQDRDLNSGAATQVVPPDAQESFLRAVNFSRNRLPPSESLMVAYRADDFQRVNTLRKK